MIYLGTSPLAGKLKSKLFASSDTFVVPADVDIIWVDGSAGGSGGGGGNSTPGGGGGGGAAGANCLQVPLPVTPAETLTLTIGAAGAGGAADNNGAGGGLSTISRSSNVVLGLQAAGSGVKGTNPNGGSGGYPPGSQGSSGSVGGAGAGPNNYSIAGFGASSAGGQGYAERYGMWSYPTAGGALGFSGGANTQAVRYAVNAGASGNASGGGGGHGGCGLFGNGGLGGSNGGAGANATGYGAGGGGGSGNSAGGNGSPGFFRLYMLTGYNI